MRKRISMTALALCALGPWPASAVLAQTHATTGTRNIASATNTNTNTHTDTDTDTAAQPALSKGEIKAMREFKLLDFNGDGKLSRSEVKLFPRLANAFDEADTDKDNYVSYEEVQVFAAKYRAERDRQRAAAESPAAPPATANGPAQAQR